MDDSIQNSAGCEMCSVIRFLIARDIHSPESHWQLVIAYGENVINDNCTWMVLVIYQREKRCAWPGHSSVIIKTLKTATDKKRRLQLMSFMQLSLRFLVYWLWNCLWKPYFQQCLCELDTKNPDIKTHWREWWTEYTFWVFLYHYRIEGEMSCIT